MKWYKAIIVFISFGSKLKHRWLTFYQMSSLFFIIYSCLWEISSVHGIKFFSLCLIYVGPYDYFLSMIVSGNYVPSRPRQLRSGCSYPSFFLLLAGCRGLPLTSLGWQSHKMEELGSLNEHIEKSHLLTEVIHIREWETDFFWVRPLEVSVQQLSLPWLISITDRI